MMFGSANRDPDGVGRSRPIRHHPGPQGLQAPLRVRRRDPLLPRRAPLRGSKAPIALEAVLDRLPGLRPDGDPVRVKAAVLHGFESLPVAWDEPRWPTTTSSSRCRSAACTVPNRIARTAHSTGTTGEDLIAYHEERAQGGVGLSDHRDRRRAAELGDRHPGVLRRRAAVLRGAQPRGCTPTAPRCSSSCGTAARRTARAGQPISASAPCPTPSVERDPAADDEGDDRRHRRRVRRGGQRAAATAASTGSSCTAPTATSSASSCRRPRTCATTSTAARPRTARASSSRSSAPSAPRSAPDFPVGVRLSGTDFIEGGIDPVEAAAIARLIEPLVDFLDVSMGSYWRFHKFLSTMDDPLGYEIATQRAGHQGGGRADHRDRADHDARPRQPPRGDRRGRHGVDGAGDDRRPLPGGEGPRPAAKPRSGRASARAWVASPS